jgi:hypothetical protein
MRIAHAAIPILCCLAILLFERIFSTNDSYEEQDDCDNEKDMDKPADGVDADDAEEPQYEQYDCNCYKHDNKVNS